MATNWSGICDNVSKISNPTLVITGTYDVVVPSANSLVIAAKVPGIWLVQIKDAGHALMSQYPINSIKYYKGSYRSQQKSCLTKRS
jgi:pimeloyl-ACP methyl ester carboxylesterase